MDWNLSRLIFCLCACSLVAKSFQTSLSQDEYASLLSQNSGNENLWDKLLELQKCAKPKTLKSTIIMSDESLKAGAKFISRVEVYGSLQCQFECCSKMKEGCNVAVFAEKDKFCYLFNCGSPSICQFDYHVGFSTSLISGLAEEDQSILLSTTKEELSTAATPTSQLPPRQLKLLQSCRAGIDSCLDKNSECSKGFCLCKNNFHHKNGVCRSDCLPGLQFECTNGDAKYLPPDCIAIYDVCDGTPQCADASDEKDCKAEEMSDGKEHAPTMGDSYHLANAINQRADVLANLVNFSISSTSTTAQPPKLNLTTVKNLVELKMISNDTHINVEAEVASSKMEQNTTSRSAVIALSLSLTVTVMLVIYLGCQYRTMRKRALRSGKPFRGSEVDYLIDGMYL